MPTLVDVIGTWLGVKAMLLCNLIRDQECHSNACAVLQTYKK
jgi:hypothetical protein